MKRQLLLCILPAAAAVAAPSDEFVNFIRQVQYDTGTEYDLVVPSEGMGTSATVLPDAGSSLQLWTVHSATMSDYLLDAEFASAYFASSSVTISTGDPYSAVLRTRVDQPFTVTIQVEGLTEELPPSLFNNGHGNNLDKVDSSNEGNTKKVDESGEIDDEKHFVGGGSTASDIGPNIVELDPSEVLFVHKAYPYPKGVYGVVDPATTGQLVSEFSIAQMGTTALSFPASSLVASDLISANGEEVFTIAAKVGIDVAATVLDSVRIQIWAIARGSLSGLDPTVAYEAIPPVSITLEDLYPASTTYLRVYKGAPASAPSEVTKVRDSVVILDDAVPGNREMVLTTLDDLMDEDGKYTLELIHQTPFGADLMDQITIEVDRTLEVRGSIYSTGH